MSSYDQVLARPGGGRALAVSRLKRAILASLHEALAMSGIESQSDLARCLHVRRSAVNQVFLGDGNVRIKPRRAVVAAPRTQIAPMPAARWYP